MSDDTGPLFGSSSRPADEPTINEAGTASFAVDGTDSFAVPGPADGLPPDDADGRAAAWLARRRMLVTLGAAAALLALVLVIANAGHSGSADDDRLRGDKDGSAYTLPKLFGVGDKDTEATEVTELTTSGTMFGDVIGTDDGSFDTSYSFDDVVPSTDPYAYTPDTYSSETFAPYVPPYRPTPTVASRRIPPPVNRAPVRTVPRTASTTSTTTTTSSTTTTPSTTTTTTTTTTAPPATLPPPPEWKPATAGLTVACGEPVRIWAGSHVYLALVGTAGYRSTDGGATWTGVTGVGPPTAFADADAATGWIGTDAGVFRLDGTQVGADIGKVTSLSAAGSESSLVAVVDGNVRRWDGTNWQPIAATWPDAAKPGVIVAIDSQTFVVGSDKGVLRSSDGGATLTTVAASPGGVVGAPVHQGPALWWLRAGGAGVVVSTDGGATWTTGSGQGVAADASALAQVPGLGLVTTGKDTNLVASADGGVSWTALPTQPPYRPEGVAHDATAKVTLIWATGCTAGTAPTHAILRLADS